jgi:hypothetical protein
MNLQDAVLEEVEKIMAFKTWYSKMNIKNPEHFPLELPEDNRGVWFEMMAEFDIEDPQVIETLGWN